METIRKHAQRKLCPEELLKIYDNLVKKEKAVEEMIPQYRSCWKQLDTHRLKLFYSYYETRETRRYITIHREVPSKDKAHLLATVSLVEDILVDKRLWHYDSTTFGHLKTYCGEILERKSLPEAELEIREHLDDLKKIISPILKAGEYECEED